MTEYTIKAKVASLKAAVGKNEITVTLSPHQDSMLTSDKTKYAALIERSPAKLPDVKVVPLGQTFTINDNIRDIVVSLAGKDAIMIIIVDPSKSYIITGIEYV